jgi:hypothetical protein
MKATPALRARIEESAKAKGLSIAQEVERTILDAYSLEDALGGSTNIAFFRLAAAAIKTVENHTGKRWWEDPKTFHAVTIVLPVVMTLSSPIPPAEITELWIAAQDDEELPLPGIAGILDPDKKLHQGPRIDAWRKAYSEWNRREAGVALGKAIVNSMTSFGSAAAVAEVITADLKPGFFRRG